MKREWPGRGLVPGCWRLEGWAAGDEAAAPFMNWRCPKTCSAADGLNLSRGSVSVVSVEKCEFKPDKLWQRRLTEE
jgi:hypothetical protein